ncbi:nuclear transport factor 2 family protein [Pseudomonas sp. CM25]|uniref:nuclear transport factor 2 family protein n=1 Tax=Pseudomonas sp. CM25 TaxID=2738448 RepID=UPI001552E7F6|nr:nuclear transport factor 2 family protein [Pseudomonas sp. CM25]NQD55791.1 nuclear transport factor 2 family protein [Pseudomonas sp. CM25]
MPAVEVRDNHPEILTRAVLNYLTELEKGDPESIIPLFSPSAVILSPFLGNMAPRPFFEKLKSASGPSKITPIDICVSQQGYPRATGYFRYDWVLQDGTPAPFECVDVFEFDTEGLITKMTIIYDTYPIRELVGDKYSS